MKKVWIWHDLHHYPRVAETPVSDREAVEYVSYDDHAAALAEKDVEIERLKEQVNEKEFDMHSRIRAEYDKTVAEAWKAALAAEKEKVRELVEALNLAIVHKYTHDGRILLEKCKEEPNA